MKEDYLQDFILTENWLITFFLYYSSVKGKVRGVDEMIEDWLANTWEK